MNRAGCGWRRLTAVVAFSPSQELATAISSVSCSQRGLGAQTLCGPGCSGSFLPLPLLDPGQHRPPLVLHLTQLQSKTSSPTTLRHVEGGRRRPSPHQQHPHLLWGRRARKLGIGLICPHSPSLLPLPFCCFKSLTRPLEVTPETQLDVLVKSLGPSKARVKYYS